MTAAQLRKYCENNGRTQEWVATALDVNVRTVRRWVSGETDIPRMAHLALVYLHLHPYALKSFARAEA